MSGDLEIYDEPKHGGADYILQVKVKNGPLLRALRMRGYETMTKFCEAHGFKDVSRMYEYLGLKRPPINAYTGQWEKPALKLAQALRLPPDSLWPEQHLQEALAVTTGELEVSKDEVALMLQPEAHDYRQRELTADAVAKVLQTLTPREERLMRMRYGFDDGKSKTLEECGKVFNVQRERIRQMEAKCFRKMLTKQRMKILTDADVPGVADAALRQKRLAQQRLDWLEKNSRVVFDEHLAAAQREVRDEQSETRVELDDDIWVTPDEGKVARTQGFVFFHKFYYEQIKDKLEGELKFVAEKDDVVKLRIA